MFLKQLNSTFCSKSAFFEKFLETFWSSKILEISKKMLILNKMLSSTASEKFSTHPKRMLLISTRYLKYRVYTDTIIMVMRRTNLEISMETWRENFKNTFFWDFLKLENPRNFLKILILSKTLTSIASKKFSTHPKLVL